ncbi:hypothetical protein C1646_693393 [Rhizophagus diaphanus]|nr:hypothetical protein C1646_693393 [Rhizophagus diaphanus] [Rhizophagus sp. MUCL 43196]
MSIITLFRYQFKLRRHGLWPFFDIVIGAFFDIVDDLLAGYLRITLAGILFLFLCGKITKDFSSTDLSILYPKRSSYNSSGKASLNGLTLYQKSFPEI